MIRLTNTHIQRIRHSRVIGPRFRFLLAMGLVGAIAGALISSRPVLAVSPPGQPDYTEWIEASINNLQHSSQRWIQVDLSNQQLTAWEGNTPVFSSTVSTGRASDATPTGVYEIQAKYRTARMQGNNYDIPDVPYTMYFSGSYAIHGAYWHDDFGAPISSGCINLPIQDAAWLFDWAGTGTTVVVQN